MSHRRAFLKSLAAAGAGGLAGALGASRRLDASIVALGETPGVPLRMSEDYLLASNVTYFNHASIGTVPRVVHEAHKAYLGLCETNPWLYMWGGAWEEPRETVRAQAAALLRCRPTEVAITHNTTEGFNLLAQGLPLGPGDEVVFSSLNHPGASICFEHQAGVRGFAVSRFEFPITLGPALTVDDVLEVYDAHIGSRTRLVVFPHVDNIIGMRYPMEALARLAKDKGVDFVAVDGAQTLGMIPVDLAESAVDFYSGSPHKWIQAPKGTGLLYVAEPVQSVVRPMRTTWGQTQWEGTVRVFEDYGTRNLPEVLALGDALEFQAALGERRKLEYYARLRSFLSAAVESSPGFSWRSPVAAELVSSVHAVGVAAGGSRELAGRMFRDHGYVMRAFETDALNTIRISLNLANTERQITRFFELAG